MKKNNGVTLAALTLSIIVLIIIMAVTVNVSMTAIKESKLEDLKTNMLIIQAKAKVYIEEVNFQIAKLDKTNDAEKIENIKSEILKGEKIEKCSQEIKDAAQNAGITATENYYYLSQEVLSEMGINNIKLNTGEYYLVKYDIDNSTSEIVNTLGYQRDGENYYTLTELNSL